MPWDDVYAALAASGWQARAVTVDRLAELRARVAGVLGSGALPAPTAEHLIDETDFALPAAVAAPRSVVVAAQARPLTQATLTLAGGEQRTVPVPPTYAGYHTKHAEFAAALSDALAAAGHRAAHFDPPLKTLACCSGLARYGRNNVAFVTALGSYVCLSACVTDAPPPGDDGWGEPQALERCDKCQACRRACPTGAIAADRFLLHTERCLTTHNESLEPFPQWIDPTWHECAVGCLHCQRACPENVKPRLTVAAPEVFDADETAAILAAVERSERTAETTAKLASCGLDYSPQLIARNLRAALRL